MNHSREWIEKFSLLATRMKDDYFIVMVCNVKGKTKSKNNYIKTPIDSEYYSIEQFEEISSAITALGFSLKTYFDENDFIKAYLQGDLTDNYPKKILVLNSAQKGTAEGRKSLIPAFCDMNNLVHTNSDAYTSSFSRNKYHWFSILNHGGYNVCESWLYDEHSGWIFEKSPKIGTKVICKLNSESSSIGLSKKNIFLFSKEKEEYIKTLSKEFNQRVIVQEFIEGKEIEIPVLVTRERGISLPSVGIKIGEEIELGNRILDYDIRGNNKFSFYNFSKKFQNIAEILEIQAAAIAYDIGIYGFGRIDYRVDKNNQFYITDISTNPHITKSMSFYYAFKELGFKYENVLLTLLGMGISRSQSIVTEEQKTLSTGETIFINRRMPNSVEWIKLREAVNWNTHSSEIHEAAARSSLYGVVILDKNKAPIGMGRVIGDGSICFYIQDVEVIPEWRNKKIGEIIMNELIIYIMNVAEPNAIIGLMAADEKIVNYYEKFGFKTRRDLRKGPGMNKE